MTSEQFERDLESFPKDTVERARAIKERVDRVAGKRTKYRINDPSQGRIAVGDRPKDGPDDPHTVHLIPQH